MDKSPGSFGKRGVPPLICQRLVGTVVDAQYKGIPNQPVRVFSELRGKDLTTKTDGNGWFVLKEVPAQERTIKVASSKGTEERATSLFIANHTTVNLVYDVRKSKLGVLSLFSSVETEQSTRLAGTNWHTEITGQCLELEPVLGKFDIWVLWKLKTESAYRVHQTPAQIHTDVPHWSVNLPIGDTKNPPKHRDLWEVRAIAMPRSSTMEKLSQVRDLRTLPPHLRTTSATFRTHLLKG